MLERLVNSILQRFAGRWIKRFNKNDLKVSTLDGTVRLRNVEVKLEEIDAMCLPVSPKMIFIGEVDMDVPFLHLKTQPIVVVVKDVYVLLTTTECPQVRSGTHSLGAARRVKRGLGFHHKGMDNSEKRVRKGRLERCHRLRREREREAAFLLI